MLNFIMHLEDFYEIFKLFNCNDKGLHFYKLYVFFLFMRSGERLYTALFFLLLLSSILLKHKHYNCNTDYSEKDNFN